MGCREDGEKVNRIAMGFGMPVSTPKKIDEFVKRFCKSIQPNHSPVFVDFFYIPECKEGECFYNVQKIVDREGGQIIYGWIIWSWPNVYMEAEHHAVWKNTTGKLLDVTPKAHSEKIVLFLPDPLQSYDFATEKRQDNIRTVMTQDPIVAQFLQISAEVAALIEKNSTGRMASLGEDYIQLEMSRAQILDKIYHKYLGPNDLCTCNSGKKIKKCCGLEAAKAILRRGQ